MLQLALVCSAAIPIVLYLFSYCFLFFFSPQHSDLLRITCLMNLSLLLITAIEKLNGYEWHGRQLAASIVPAFPFYPMASPSPAPFSGFQPRTRLQLASSIPLGSNSAAAAAQFGMMPYQIGAQPYAEYYDPAMQYVPSLVPMQNSYYPQQQQQVPQPPIQTAHYQPRLQQSHSSSMQPQPVDKRKVFIGNIPFSTQWHDLREFVQAAGKVVRVDIIMNDENQSRGFAIAVFASDEDAQQAIESLDGQKFEGRVLTVRLDRFPDSRPSPNAAAAMYAASIASSVGSMHQSATSSALTLTSSSSGDSSPGSRNFTTAAPNGSTSGKKYKKYSNSSGSNSAAGSRSNSYSSPGMAYYAPPYYPASDMGAASGWAGTSPASAAAAAYWNAAAQYQMPAGYSAMQSQLQGLSLMPSPAASALSAQSGRFAVPQQQQQQQQQFQSFAAGPSYGMPPTYGMPSQAQPVSFQTPVSPASQKASETQ